MNWLSENFNNIFKKENSGLNILTYHGIIKKRTENKLERNFHTEKQFIDQLTFIKRKKLKVLSIHEITEFVQNKNIPKNCIGITFDDGYENNLKAIEILEDFGFPATIFISTGSINQDTSIWTVNLSLLILKGKLKNLKFDDISFDLTDEKIKIEAFTYIRNNLKKLNYALKKSKFSDIIHQYGNQELEDLIQQHPQFRMLTWKQIKDSLTNNYSFQSHGDIHEIHHENQDKDIIESEIIISKNKIETELGIPCEYFCFPNGNFNQYSLDVLRKNHYKSGFCLNESSVLVTDDIMAISRITPNKDFEKFTKQIK